MKITRSAAGAPTDAAYSLWMLHRGPHQKANQGLFSPVATLPPFTTALIGFLVWASVTFCFGFLGPLQKIWPKRVFLWISIDPTHKSCLVDIHNLMAIQATTPLRPIMDKHKTTHHRYIYIHKAATRFMDIYKPSWPPDPN